MQAWENFIKLQERELGVDTVEKWLRPLKIKRFDACNLYLEAKDSFQMLWFEEHVRHQLQKKFLNNNKKLIKVHVSVNNDTDSTKTQRKSKNKSSLESSNSLLPFSIVFEELNPYCTLENFIGSETNLLACKLLEEAVENASAESSPSSLAFNPIFLHGQNGVGKSHLLMAAAHALRLRKIKVLYSRAETFTENVIKAIRAGEMQTFRKAYRNIDVLIIDDIHSLSRKSATQEEFFHTFNTLHLEGKQIILSSNFSPQELKFIEPRLISRFEWGIVLPLTLPPRDKLYEILLCKAKSLHFPLQNDIAQYLLDTFTSNTKSLIRALEALTLRLHLNANLETEKNLTVETLKESLSDLIREERQLALTPEKILQSVAEFYGIRINDILSKSHAREYTLPRQVSMFLCRSHLNMPYMKIGEIFSRDHSTVMTSVKQIQKNLSANDKEMNSNIHSIVNRFQLAR